MKIIQILIVLAVILTKNMHCSQLQGSPGHTFVKLKRSGHTVYRRISNGNFKTPTLQPSQPQPDLKDQKNELLSPKKEIGAQNNCACCCVSTIIRCFRFLCDRVFPTQ